MKHKLNHADIKAWAANYDGELFDGILCDPPYELGFMGKSWDSSGVAYDKEMWADLFKLLKPGGHLLAFSGSRTYHRMAVAIEDAGFEIRDMIEWVYGSGFPKSLNIGKAVDKLQGNEREWVGKNPNGRPNSEGNKSGSMGGGAYVYQELTKGNSPYEGYGTALKPAHEPCVLARKPLTGTVAANVLKHGTGGLNIDGTRVATTDNTAGKTSMTALGQNSGWNAHENKQVIAGGHDAGRFPANLIHDGSDEVEAVFPQSKSTPWPDRKSTGWKQTSKVVNGGGIADSGSAARFFYTAKASKSERNAGLEGFEDKEQSSEHFATARLNDQRMTGEQQRLPNKNHHPTIKPLSLTKYLATLIKPPTGGRLLVPFSGSGSEMIGALQAGWEYVEGVELTEEYIPIAEARIAHWVKIPVQDTLI